MTIRLVLAIVFACVGLVVPSAHAQSSPDVTVFGPPSFWTADVDDVVRFSWYPDNSQDYFRVVFSQYRSFGWETSPYQTRETPLNSILATPREIGLAPGTWYWRICFRWSDSPSSCYLDDDIRTLDVNERPPPTPFLSLSVAQSTARSVIRRKFRARPAVGCARVTRSQAVCRALWRRAGRKRGRWVDVEARADGIYYAIRVR